MYVCVEEDKQNKALCGSWAPHRAGRTGYGVTNDGVANAEQQSKHDTLGLLLHVLSFSVCVCVCVCVCKNVEMTKQHF